MTLKTFLTAISFLLCLTLVACAPYETTIDASQFSNEALKEVLQNIEKEQEDSSHFARLGENKYSKLLNLFLLASVLSTGTAAVIEGSKLWEKTSRQRLILLFILSIGATISSGLGLFAKGESERFFQENRNEFNQLSLKMDATIRDFYFAFRVAEYNDSSMEQPAIRKKFLDLSQTTFARLGDLRREYNDKYGLPTNQLH